MRTLMAGMLVTAALAEPAGAASFDCSRARAADEKIICADRALNDADVRMTTMLAIAEGFVAMGGRGAMHDDQAAWLKARHGCGGDRRCLKKSYAGRIATIQKILAGLESRGPF